MDSASSVVRLTGYSPSGAGADVVVERGGVALGLALRSADRLVVGGEPLEGRPLVLVPRGFGRPTLGRLERGHLLGEPGGVRCGGERWRAAGQVLAVARRPARGGRRSFGRRVLLLELSSPVDAGVVSEVRRLAPSWALAGGPCALADGADVEGLLLLLRERFGLGALGGSPLRAATADDAQAATLALELASPGQVVHALPGVGPAVLAGVLTAPAKAHQLGLFGGLAA